MLNEEVVTCVLFVTRLNQFFKRGNKPIFCGGDLTQRIDRNPTIRGYKFPALPMLDILDVGEARVFQFFCYCEEHDRTHSIVLRLSPLILDHPRLRTGACETLRSQKLRMLVTPCRHVALLNALDMPISIGLVASVTTC